MFLKGFICGWLGMAALVMATIWTITPHEYGYLGAEPDKPSYDMGYDYRAC